MHGRGPALRRVVKQLGFRAIHTLRGSPWQRGGGLRVLVQTCRGFEERHWREALDAPRRRWADRVEVLYTRCDLAFGAALHRAQVCCVPSLGDLPDGVGRELRWVHTLVAGVDSADMQGPPPFQLTTSRGIAANGMAQHALALMTALGRDPRTHTVVVVGLGAYGTAAARICRARGARVVGVTRRPGRTAGLCDQEVAFDNLAAALPLADIVVLAVPLTPRTERLIGRDELAAMKRTALVINVARGRLIDEHALADALHGGTIGGAGLDVLSQEPQPSDHPLHGCPNLIVTPHVAGNILRFRQAITARFVANLGAFLDNGGLEGIVP